MFDMGFLEILVIVVIGLVVIGPERLPGAIKTCVIWVNGIRRNVTAARTEFEKQIGADEIRREIHNEEILASLRAAKKKQEEMRKQIASGEYTGIFKTEEQAQPSEAIANSAKREADDTLAPENTEHVINPEHDASEHINSEHHNSDANTPEPNTSEANSSGPSTSQPKPSNP